MIYLLFPGRHLLNTKFQEDYLWGVLRLPIEKLNLIKNGRLAPDDKIGSIVFAVTSSNQSNSRYNPIAFHHRIINLDRFAKQYKDNLGVNYKIFGIPRFPHTSKFAEYVLKEIAEVSESDLKLTPENTIVLCSTKSLIDQYTGLGFSILPAEFDPEEGTIKADTPIDIIKQIVERGEYFDQDKNLADKLAKTSMQFLSDFPDVVKKILRLWRDPLMTDSGSLTEERNYSTYAYGMNHESLINLKYQDIVGAVKEGKIADEGCADGALMIKLAKDFPDSDIIGIEITTEFTARCEERLRAGEFGGSFVYFHQRNLLEKIFEDNSIDTTICNSTTHELWSYADKGKSLTEYLSMKYDQTSKNGRIVIRDVVGPEDKESMVYMELNDSDGNNENIFYHPEKKEDLQQHLSGLSTYARFLRFAEDYLSGMRQTGKRSDDSKIKFEEIVISGKKYINLRLKDAVEFITKKDYTDNWNSELNEEFAFWSFSEWKENLVKVGFRIIENPNEADKSSREYTNEWIVDNRWRGKVKFFKMNNNILEEMDYPPTNMVLIGEKPIS